MAERLAYLEAVVGADITQFRRGMRDIRNEMGFLSETVSGLTGLGRNLTYTLTTPLVSMGGVALETASDFQASMYNINAIASLTGGELEALSNRALEFGAATRSGAQAAADALYTVFSAGLTDADQAFSAMEVATYTAEAGLADLTTTTEALLAVMLSYGDTSEEMAWRASNAMTQMVAVGVGSMQEFANALGNVVPTATALGMDINQLMGDMAFLTQRGLSAAKSGTALNSALTALIKPTEAMSAAMSSLGAGSSQELIDQFGGVNEAIKALIESTGGSQEQLAAMFGNIRGLRAINLFATDIEGWGASMDEFYGKLDGATMRAWEQQMQSFSASWDMLKSAVEGASVAIGQQMFPVLQPIVDTVRDLVLEITNANPEFLALAVTFGAVAAAAPPILWVLTSLISPFGLLIAAVGAFGVAVETNFGGIKDTIINTTGEIEAALVPLVDTIGEFWEAVFPSDIAPTTAGLDLENLYEFPAIEDLVNINPSGGAISLWDFYEKEGFIDTMSWDEFMEKATDGGWEGGAITPDKPITLSLGDAPIDTSFRDHLAEVNAEFEVVSEEIPQTFAERFQSAMANVFPKIGQAVTGLFGQAVTWFDGFGGIVLRSITRSINSIDEGAIYTAFTQVVSGDWSGLLDTLGLGGDDIKTSIEGWKDKIEEALPEVTAGLSSLLTNASNWIIDEGVPLFAMSMGYLAGKIGVMLYDAVQAGIGFFTGGGASDAASGIASYMDESIATPFQEGIADATSGSNLATDVWATLGTGLSTGLATTVQGVDLTNVYAALQIKVGELGDWFKDEGLAQMMEGIGYWSGKLSVAIGQAVSSAFNWITGGGEDTTGSAISLGEDIAQPFSDGFNQALGESEVTGIDAIVTGLVDAFLIYTTVNTFLPVGAAIGLSIAKATQLWSWAATAFGIVRKISASIGISALVSTGWSAAVAGIGTGLSSAMAAVAAGASWVTGIATSIMGAIGSAIAAIGLGTLAMGVATVTLAIAGLILIFSPEAREAVRESVAGLFGFENYDQMAANWEEGISNSIKGVIDTFDGQPNIIGQVDQSVDVELLPEVTAQSFNENTQRAIDEITGTSQPFFASEQEVQTQFNFTPTGTFEENFENSPPVEIPTAYLPPTQEEVKEDLPTVEVGSSLEITDVTFGGDTDLTAISAAFADQLASGADMQTIIDEQLIPLEDAWVAMFAPEGDMTVNFTSFTTSVTGGFADMDFNSQQFFLHLNENIPSAIANFANFASSAETSVGSVRAAMLSARGAASGLLNTIKNLLSLEGTLDVSVNISGGVSTDGSHAKGLPSVPFDGYIAELHKDERVLTAAEAKAYNDGESGVRVSPHATQGGLPRQGGDNTVNNVNLQGNLTVDQILFEFKRRGIKFNNGK